MIRAYRLLVAACAATMMVTPSAVLAARAEHIAPAKPAGPFALLPSPAGPGSGQPNLAVAPDSTVWLSWLEPHGPAGRALRASRLVDGAWSEPLTVVAGDSVMAIGPDIPVLLPMGGQRLVALYLWRIPMPHAREVRLVQSANSGRTWSAPVVAHRDRTPTEHGFASLVTDPRGARAVWLDGRNSAVTDSTGRQIVHEEGVMDMVLRSAVLTAEGSLIDEGELDGRVCDCCPTAAAATGRGALVAYRDRSAEEVRDISVLRYEGGTWAAPQAVSADGWKIQGCPVNGPAIAAEGDRVGIAWFTAAADTNRVRFAFSADGGRSFGAPLRLDQGSPTGRVSAVLLPDGSAFAAWLETEESGFHLMARRITPHGAAGPVVTVATIPPGRGGSFPRMARAGDRILLTWTEPGKPAQIKTATARLEALTTR